MIWLTWRQFRTQAVVIFGALAVVAVPAVITGLQTRHWVATCATAGACLGGTAPAGAYMARFGWLQLLLGGGLLALPAITGMFGAAPLVAREYDTGTFRLVWTQSVGRIRWLTVKIAVVGTASVLAAGLLSWLTTWWFQPADQVQHHKFVDSTFGIRDVVPLGYAAFAFAVGLTAGLLIRKVLPAMATTLGVFVVARMTVQMFVRSHYATALTQTLPMTESSGDVPGQLGAGLPTGSWVVSMQIIEPSGQPLNHPLQLGPAAPCSATGTCLRGYTQRLLYQPGSRYWPFQWTETGLFTLVALLLVGFCYWWIVGRPVPGRAARPPVARPAAVRPRVVPALPEAAAPADGVGSSPSQINRARLTGVDR
jgi:hypothetical protein